MIPQKVAYLDLTTRKVRVEEVAPQVIRQFLGGRGMNMYLLRRHVIPRSDALAPCSPLIIGPGLLTGFKGLGASRCNISGKSPETGLLGDANIGGYFGAYLKQTGIDYLVITGQAKKPVYVDVSDEGIVIKDATDLWGRSTIETHRTLKERYGEASESLTIGLAGENLVRFACIVSRRKNVAGRTGLGCLMGAKNLKAIVVRGGKERVPVNKAGVTRLRRYLQGNLKEEPLVKLLREFGSAFLFMLINRRIGMGRAYNGQTTKIPENEDVSPRVLHDKYYRKRQGCYYCPVSCHHEYKVGDVVNEGPEYTILASFGPVLGIKNIEAVLRINEILNRYGLDGSSTANLIAWATELYQRGLINDATTCGLKLTWGDEAVITELIEQIVRREGFGEVLAGGAREAVARLGPTTVDYLIWTKYLPQSDPVDLRYFPAYALGNALSTRGSDHLRSRPTWEAHGLSPETLEAVYGGPVVADPRSYQGKGRVIWWWETYLAIIDSLGLCKLIAHNCSPGKLDFKFMAELIGCAAGLEITADELFRVGERIITTERDFLVGEGLSRCYDFPPPRYFVPLARQEGLKPEETDLALDRASFDGMLDEYYELRGWDQQGRPRAATREGLGIN